jgi:hypothetical protein
MPTAVDDPFKNLPDVEDIKRLSNTVSKEIRGDVRFTKLKLWPASRQELGDRMMFLSRLLVRKYMSHRGLFCNTEDEMKAILVRMLNKIFKKFGSFKFLPFFDYSGGTYKNVSLIMKTLYNMVCLFIAVLHKFVLILMYLQRDAGFKAIHIGLSSPRFDMGGVIFPFPKSLDTGRVQYWASMRFMDQEFGIQLTEFMRSDHKEWTVSIIAIVFLCLCSGCCNYLSYCYSIFFCYIPLLYGTVMCTIRIFISYIYCFNYYFNFYIYHI